MVPGGRPSDPTGRHDEPGGGEAPAEAAERQAVLRVTRALAIPLDELAWRFTTSGGPGGQHANKTSTRAEVRFDVERSPSLGPRQRARLLERLGPVVRVASGDERSQARNRDEALRRLAARLAEGLHTERPRLPTKPTQGSKTRRREDKRRQSVRKRDRLVRGDDGD
jgi:ribosome-associated protein